MKIKFGSILLILCLFFAFAGPLLTSYSYDAIDLKQINRPPSWLHPFGTDDLGRDLLSRTAHGLRLSLAIGCAAAIIDCLIGILWGASAALIGGRFDAFIMTCVDILAAIPQTILAIIFLVILGPGIFSLLAALVISGWITMARLMRSHVYTLVSKEYVLSSRLLGAGFIRILFSSILPNSREVIIATLLLTVPQAIFLESFLSFLGLGVPPPAASLGSMIQEALSALPYFPWRLLIPAAWVSIAMLAFNLLGENRENTDASFA